MLYIRCVQNHKQKSEKVKINATFFVLGFKPTETKLLLVNNRAMTIKQALLESIEHHNPDMLIVGTQGMHSYLMDVLQLDG